MWFIEFMREFFFTIDNVVFGFIGEIYDILISLARTSILSQADIIDMAERVYKLLAIFMIFKVTFSLIMYVVNPDDFSDKSKGVGKLGLNIIISLSLLILTPYIFSYAYQIQTIILEDNSLSVLIFGDENNNVNESPFNTAGEKMSYIVMLPFFAPNTEIPELYQCAQLTVKKNDKNVFNPKCSGLDDNLKSTSDTTSLYELTQDEENEFSEETLKNYVTGINIGSLGLTFRDEMVVAKSDDEWIIDYKFPFSTAVGVVVVLLLINFCMDVAVRSIKLAFLQLIAPIPIISYIDPKSGKDGLFKKWYEMCFKTYLSLFIRLLAIYFVAYIIDRLDKMIDIVDGSYVSQWYIKIFVIIGALMFAKQFPKILEGLGIKLDSGAFNLNPLRKIEKEALGGGLLKKPNDFLKKVGMGVLKSPLSGAALFGKKSLGALYSASQGRGLKAGWNRTHGNLYNSINKTLDSWIPGREEDRKNRIKGEENQEARKIRERRARPHISRVNSHLDQVAKSKGYKNAADWKARDYASYATEKYTAEKGMFRNSEYSRSYEALASAKLDASKKHQAATDIDQKYQAALSGAEVTVGGVKYGGKDGRGLDELKRIRDGAVASASSADGRVESLKRTHEDVKLKYSDDAYLETAYDEFGKAHEWTYGHNGEFLGWDAHRPIDISESEESSSEGEESTSEAEESTSEAEESTSETENRPTPDVPEQTTSDSNREYRYASQQAYDERIEFAESKLHELIESGASEDEIRAQGTTIRNLHEAKRQSYEKDEAARRNADEADERYLDEWMSQGRADDSDNW